MQEGRKMVVCMCARVCVCVKRKRRLRNWLLRLRFWPVNRPILRGIHVQSSRQTNTDESCDDKTKTIIPSTEGTRRPTTYVGTNKQITSNAGYRNTTEEVVNIKYKLKCCYAPFRLECPIAIMLRAPSRWIHIALRALSLDLPAPIDMLYGRTVGTR